MGQPVGWTSDGATSCPAIVDVYRGVAVGVSSAPAKVAWLVREWSSDGVCSRVGNWKKKTGGGLFWTAG